MTLIVRIIHFNSWVEKGKFVFAYSKKRNPIRFLSNSKSKENTFITVDKGDLLYSQERLFPFPASQFYAL